MTLPTHPQLRVGVIIPVYNGAAFLERSLAALRASSRTPDCILIVDDGSTDGSADLAAGLGFEVMRADGGPRGPGPPRNLGMHHLDVDVAVFADCDVAFHPDTIEALVGPLERDDSLAATFGAYDDEPECRHVAAVYANLRHHVVHMTEAGEPVTYWAAIGAVRRETALKVGGFPEEYTTGGEDYAFGAALRSRGERMRIVPTAQGKHLKDWTLSQLWRADIVLRALPWSQLIARGKVPTSSLNLRWTEKVQAILAVTLAPLIGLGALWPAFWFAAAAAAVCWILLNRRLFGLIARRGLRYLLGGLGLHLAYAHYSIAAFALVLIFEKISTLRGRRRSEPARPHRVTP